MHQIVSFLDREMETLFKLSSAIPLLYSSLFSFYLSFSFLFFFLFFYLLFSSVIFSPAFSSPILFLSFFSHLFPYLFLSSSFFYLSGGVFLSRTNLEESTQGAVQPKDLYVSAIVEMFSHKFLIHDADEYTLRYVRVQYVLGTQK